MNESPTVQHMSLSDVLRDYRDGDERGWEIEFEDLWCEHGHRMDRLYKSVQLVGIREPILLGNDGRIWDGHHRLAVAWRLGLNMVPVRFASSKERTSA